MDVHLVLVNFPNHELAREIAGKLVVEKLAACVNLLPKVESIYRWEGKVEHDEESTAIIKTTKQAYQKLEARVLELHPYENPELLLLPIEGGSKAYLQWVRETVR